MVRDILRGYKGPEETLYNYPMSAHAVPVKYLYCTFVGSLASLFTPPVFRA